MKFNGELINPNGEEATVKAGDVVLYVESPEISHAALVLGVNYPVPGEAPVLSLVYVPRAKTPDPRLEGNDWHTAVMRRGGVVHGSHDTKAGKSLYDYWCELGEQMDIEQLDALRRDDKQAVASLPAQASVHVGEGEEEEEGAAAE